MVVLRKPLIFALVRQWYGYEDSIPLSNVLPTPEIFWLLERWKETFCSGPRGLTPVEVQIFSLAPVDKGLLELNQPLEAPIYANLTLISYSNNYFIIVFGCKLVI